MSGSRPDDSPLFDGGDLVEARYRIDSLLGQGGMGEVYRAEKLATGEPVALKFILPELLGSHKTRARFERELDLTQRIDHPNVVHLAEILRVPTPDGRSDLLGEEPMPCLVMEFLDGGTLADHLDLEGPMEADEARPIMTQIASALSAAHRQGVVHRDLKPDNVFLVPPDEPDAETPRVVLTDFGVARQDKDNPNPELSDSLTASNVVIGTPEYMAPELLELEGAIPASDIYAMGLVYHELVTGVLPFDELQPLQALFQRVRQEVPTPRERRPDLDEDTERVILRCLARQPTERYADAADLIRDLEGEEIDTPTPKTEIPRELLAIASVATVIIVLAILLVVLVV
ncbi:MAG: serine/threonine-protein kinase [Acidobacteriota bacterium]